MVIKSSPGPYTLHTRHGAGKKISGILLTQTIETWQHGLEVIYLLYLESSLYLTACPPYRPPQSQIDTEPSLGPDSFQTDPGLLSAISNKTEESSREDRGGGLNITNDNDWVISRQSGGGLLIASREEMEVFSVKIPPTSCCLCRS